MKSPLVDVLRQAHGDAHDDPAVEPETVSGESADNVNTPAEATISESQHEGVKHSAERAAALASAEKLGAADLNLLNTGSFSHAEITLGEKTEGDKRGLQDDATYAPNDETSDEPVDSQMDQYLIADEEQPTLGVEDAAASLPLSSSITTPSSQESRIEKRIPLAPKLGRLTPVICLIALSVSAGSHYIVSQVAGQSLNEDLNGMAQRKGAQSATADTDTANLALHEAGENIFADTRFESTVAAANQTLSVSQNSSSTKFILTMVEPSNSQASKSPLVGTISSSTTNDGLLHDRAHSFVVDAFAAYQTKDYGLAEENYVQALDIEPNHKDALAGLAAVHLQTNRISAALRGYERLLSVNPSSAVASSAILTIHANDPEWDSESELKLLLQRYPEAHQLHSALGTVFVGTKRWADAKQSFLAAHRLAPDNANYSYNAAVSMEKVGDQGAARFYYEAALATAGQESNIDRRAVSAHLESLKFEQRDQL